MPREWIKGRWRSARLQPPVQLTFSGCLGPCASANVVLVMAAGQTIWLGDLFCMDDFAAVVRWAEETARQNKFVDVPLGLRERRFEWFQDTNA